jgi:DnaJ-class molecular chaperone
MKYELYPGLVTGGEGGNVRECEECRGEGYVQVGSTTVPEANELELCSECEGSGVVDEHDDAAVDSYIEEQAFDNE